MKTKLFGLVVCMALLGVSPSGATTYSVNGTPGNVLGVTGFITTDGNSGFLGSADIVDWSLMIPATNGGVAFTLNKSNSSLTLGTDLLSATSTALSFNFSSSAPSSLSFIDAMYLVEWTSGILFSGGLGGIEEIGDGPCSFCFANSPPFFGTEIIATTPLPATLPLFGTGLGLLSLLGWKRKRKIAAVA